MNIEKVESNPYDKSIFPSISFEVEISRRKYHETIIGIGGYLMTDDNMIIAILDESEFDKPKTEEVGAKGSRFDRDFKEGIYKTLLIALLNRKALEHIEKRRMKNRKGDVKLILCLNMKYIETRARIFESFLVKPKDVGLSEIRVPTSRDTQSSDIVVHTYDSGFSSDRTGGWILSGDGSHVFLSIQEKTFKKDAIIRSSDWIHDYAPKLELGEYFIVEIPKGEELIEAWNYIEKAEDCFRTWDTKGVYANCREVGYLLDRILKRKFGKDNFNYEIRWGKSYGRFEGLASVDLHMEEFKKSLKYSPEEVKIGKSDAEHILTLTKLLIKYAEELIKES